ncbi:ABC transporter permease subunit [Nonomuraea sp. NPDC050663]|uniref:ABC transporter permease subunit n=1 Tax=Nonomuraea sp. NPDC050663 TaxID=3364370 RepID=UPI00379C6649
MIAKTLREYRRMLIGWTIGISLFVAMYTSIYSSMDRNTLSEAVIAKYPGALRDLMGGMQDLTTPLGYLSSVVYQLFVPLLFAIMAMLLANRAIAEPEENGTLELTVTLPIDRKRLLLERFAAMVLVLLITAVLTGVVVIALVSGLDFGVPVGNVLAGHLGVFLLALFLGTVTLFCGAATGRKAIGTSAMGVWAAGGYVVVTVGKNVEAISWLRWVSPWHYYSGARPLYTGVPVGDYLVLGGAAAVLLLTAVLAFDRRDVGV